MVKLNSEQRNFRIFGPDETLSNRLTAVFEQTNRQWDARQQDNDEFLTLEGRHSQARGNRFAFQSFRRSFQID